LAQFRVLDPACGSGNFLYLALKALRDVEKRAHTQVQELGLQPEVNLLTGPHNILGIELNEFAAELARVTVWIGDIQWCRQNGWPHSVNPILKPLDGIDNRDALLVFKSSHSEMEALEAQWPRADVIVGNPPFIGGSKMRGELGDVYVETLRKTYVGRVPGGADFVCYWFEKARAMIEHGQLQAAGLVSTNSIRGGANRKVLERIVDTTRIFAAWSDEPWINDGAAVRVSMTGFGKLDAPVRLDDVSVEKIHADLTASSGVDLTTAQRLPENSGATVRGSEKGGKFDLSGTLARSWLASPNPNGISNSEVLRPWVNGMDLTKRPTDTWLIDFGMGVSESESAMFEKPFEYVVENVKPGRQRNNEERTSGNWWLHRRSGEELRAALKSIPRYICTPRVSKYRLFIWLDSTVFPDSATFVVARSDDTTFGILHSRFHELWSLRLCTYLGVGNDPRYTPSSTFETFPFPAGLTPRDTRNGAPDTHEANAIAKAAKHLDQLRTNWLNPPEWVDWVITPEEDIAGFPKRPVAKAGFEAELKKRTLTNLYNARPTWLKLAHEALDNAVAAAYGWRDYTPAMTDDDILRRLLALNQARV
jgi:type II restriction/modification system DNA methylase subunit YeeA